MVFTPASVAINFVSTPPVPWLDPSVVVWTGMHMVLRDERQPNRRIGMSTK